MGKESGYSLAGASGSRSLMGCSQAVDWAEVSSEGLTVGLGDSPLNSFTWLLEGLGLSLCGPLYRVAS